MMFYAGELEFDLFGFFKFNFNIMCMTIKLIMDNKLAITILVYRITISVVLFI